MESISSDLEANLAAHFTGRAPMDSSPDACVDDFVTDLAEAAVRAHDPRAQGTRRAQAQPVALTEESFQYRLGGASEDRVSADVVGEWRGGQQRGPGRVSERRGIAVDVRIPNPRDRAPLVRRLPSR
jgi:hypothetical protein